MYEVLKDIELEEFINGYFSICKQDIFKVSCIEYENKKEYLINEHYLFIMTRLFLFVKKLL